ncbi:hypothetical protein CALVIDRAFT_170828 [Calocera viscosa TUFC12733]|uniref:Uncharacterized protein n=1 Tax=Calocera viscosa (strain TUFC12733) TaxID=1330018 RepID=A0A167L7L4_CALVF|nr:hypothetical protein CALVIDRAFT_170828 [Calocera viscosa TUFC12733]
MTQSPASPPPLAGFNPNYPPFQFGTDGNMANGNAAVDSSNDEAARRTGPESSYFAAVMAAALANGNADSGKNSEPNSSSDDTTESSTAVSAAPSQISFGFSDTGGAKAVPTASELGLGLGLSEMMNSLTVSEGVPKLSQPVIPAAGAAREESPLKRSQTTTPSSNMLQTPTPPTNTAAVSVEEEGDIPAVVPNAWARSSLEGLVLPTLKSDRRSSWGGRNGL